MILTSSYNGWVVAFMFPAVGVSTARCSGGAWKKYSCNEKKKTALKVITFSRKKSSFLWTWRNERLSVFGINTVYCKSLLIFFTVSGITRSQLSWHRISQRKPICRYHSNNMTLQYMFWVHKVALFILSQSI